MRTRMLRGLLTFVAALGLCAASAHAQSLAGAKDVHEVIALNSAVVEPALKRAYAVYCLGELSIHSG